MRPRETTPPIDDPFPDPNGGSNGLGAAAIELWKRLKAGQIAEAIEILTSVGEPHGIDLLSQAIHDQDPVVQRAAVEVLGRIAGSQAIEPLSRALSDEHAGVRHDAANALGRIGGPHVVALVSQLNTDRFHVMRQLATTELASAGGRSALPALQVWLRILGERDNKVLEIVKAAVAAVEDATPRMAGRPRIVTGDVPVTNARPRPAADDASTTDARPLAEDAP